MGMRDWVGEVRGVGKWGRQGEGLGELVQDLEIGFSQLCCFYSRVADNACLQMLSPKSRPPPFFPLPLPSFPLLPSLPPSFPPSLPLSLFPTLPPSLFPTLPLSHPPSLPRSEGPGQSPSSIGRSHKGTDAIISQSYTHTSRH